MNKPIPDKCKEKEKVFSMFRVDEEGEIECVVVK